MISVYCITVLSEFDKCPPIDLSDWKSFINNLDIWSMGQTLEPHSIGFSWYEFVWSRKLWEHTHTSLVTSRMFARVELVDSW